MPAMNGVLIPLTRSGVVWLVSVPSPSCPELLPPHAKTEVVVPPGRVAREESAPAEMAVTWDKPATLTGTELLTVVPLPSWPSWLAPQARTVPSERSARLKRKPAETLVTPVSPATWTGVSWAGLIVPLPTWPVSLRPQAHTVPSDRRARLWLAPADTWMTPVSPVTRTGVYRSVSLPSPSSPRPLPPQAQTVPSGVRARVWLYPAEICATVLGSPVMSPYSVRPVVVPLPSTPSKLLPQLATACGWKTGPVTPRAWAGTDAAAAPPARPRVSAVQPA